MPFLSEADQDQLKDRRRGQRIRHERSDAFVGLPAGYEFSTLVADIVDVSSGTVGLSQTMQDELRGLDQDLHLQVFVTPT